MAFDFPSSPVEGQEFLAPSGPVYKYTDGKWTLMGGSAAPTPLSSFRNRIINGDFVIDQRNAGAAVTVTTTIVYAQDRWYGAAVSPGTFTMQQEADTTYLGEYALKIATGTADASLAVGDAYYFGQRIEGSNCRDFNWGNANAKPITISFTAWANTALTLPLSIRNNGITRSWLSSFAVTTTPTRFTFTVPGDVTGTWEIGNLIGMHVLISLGVGSTYQGVSGWQAGNFITLAGMSNFMAAANTLRIKDFQLELGSVATEFERVEYSEQLARCQRYYETDANGQAVMFSANVTSANVYNAQCSFKVTKRTTPTVVLTNVSASSFPATPGSPVAFFSGFREPRTANATANGLFISNFTASAEL